MRHAQLGDIFGIERDVRVATHRRHQRTVRNRHVLKDAAVLQGDGNDMQVIGGLGLIEKKLF